MTALIPIRRTGIIHVPSQEREPTTQFRFYVRLRGWHDEREYLGSITGTVECPISSERLARLRGYLRSKFGTRLEQQPAPLEVQTKESRRMTDLERYNRKLKMVQREYDRRRDEIMQTELFKQEAMAQLDQQLQETIKAMKITYNQ